MVSNQTAAGVGLDDTDTPTKWPKNPEDAVVNEMDTGALINELETLDIVPKNISLNSQEQKVIQKNPEKFMWALYEDVKPHRVQTGTYRGTQLALNKVYDLVEQR
jgi:hypothetical protein